MRNFNKPSSRPFRGSRPERNFGGRPGRSFGPRPARKIKSFDPSTLVRTLPVQEPVKNEPFVPTHTFTDFGLAPKLVENLQARNYAAPTPIQDQTIPLLMQGKDVVGIANTGTGKTAAFLLPLINKVMADKTQKVLIVAPTRELAVQIEQELAQFARGTGLTGALCIGGVHINQQIYNLRFGPQFVVGTPGRLKDLEEHNAIRFQSFNNIVLDEVDRMLDMGFVREVTRILSLLSPVRQSAFFSATTTRGVQEIMQKFLKNPITVSIKSNSVIGNISQQVVPTKGKPKIEVLHELLIREGFDKVIVFGRTKWGLEKLTNDLTKRGFGVAALHGNKTQGQRQRSLEMFKSNKVKVLLATDVASRGLDIDNVTHVINYDLPESYEDYVHRIGRTGRASKKGIALTLVER